MEILTLVDKLETHIAASSRLPATGKVLMNAGKMLELVDQMRLAIPKDIQESQQMLTQREAIINQALLDARRIKASAEEESRSQVNESAVLKEAEAKAEEILADAKRRADALLQDSQRQAHDSVQEAQRFSNERVNDSNRYAQETLYHLEQQLASALNSVRMGLDAMEEHRQVHAVLEAA